MLCIAALIYVLGVSALVGVATLVASLAFTSYLARRQSFLQDKIMHVSDKRVSAVSELLTSIKLIKLYSWQLPFSNAISKIRAEQESYLYRSTAIGAITRCLGLSSPLFVSFMSFVTYSALGYTLDATTAFTALLLFNQLKEPMGKLPECVTSLVKMWISQRRIQAFLHIKDKEDYITHPTETAASGQKAADVSIGDGWFSWGLGQVSDEHGEQDMSDELHTRSPLSHAHASPRIISPPLSLSGGVNSSSTAPSHGLQLPGILHRTHSADDSDDSSYHSMDSGRGLGISLKHRRDGDGRPAFAIGLADYVPLHLRPVSHLLRRLHRAAVSHRCSHTVWCLVSHPSWLACHDSRLCGLWQVESAAVSVG